jgi:hypothetical protein
LFFSVIASEAKQSSRAQSAPLKSASLKRAWRRALLRFARNDDCM